MAAAIKLKVGVVIVQMSLQEVNLAIMKDVLNQLYPGLSDEDRGKIVGALHVKGKWEFSEADAASLFTVELSGVPDVLPAAPSFGDKKMN